MKEKISLLIFDSYFGDERDPGYVERLSLLKDGWKQRYVTSRDRAWYELIREECEEKNSE